jgi:outer membrane cobalamin receptor
MQTRLLCLALLTLALVYAPRAAADDLADEADLKFRLGAEAYQRGDYRAALEEFLASNRLVPNRNVAYNIARCYEQLKQFPEAFRYYSVALLAETDGEARGRIERSLTAIRKYIAVLEIETSPAGATIFIQRKDLGPRGNAPTALGLKPGDYLVLAELAGHHPARVEVRGLSAGQSQRVTLLLEPLRGTLEIAGPVAGASVRVDDASAAPSCSAPCELQLNEGPHKIYVERPGFAVAELAVEVHANQRQTLRPVLTALTGTLVVSSDEPGALIEIDGASRGFTPQVLPLPVGQHRVRIALPGFKSETRDVLIERGTEHHVELTLTQSDAVNAASRSTENVEDAPSSVSIIGKREIDAMRYPTIGEALRGLPGVYGWNDRSYQAVGFRGLGRLGSYGNRVLVLVDGHPMNDNWLGSSYVGYDARLSLQDVERIEVVRGPGSVLYGTNAFAGVVNVVTRPALQPGAEVSLGTADNGAAQARVRANAPLGRDSALWTSASIGHGSGRDYYFPELDQASRDADGFDAAQLEGRYNKRWFSAAWYLESHHKQLPSGAYETIVGDPRTTQTDTRASLELKAEPRLGGALGLMTRLHLNRYQFGGDYARPPSDGGIEHDTFHGSWVGLEQRVELRASDAFKLTFGAEGQLHVQVEQQAVDDAGVILDDSRPFQVGAAYALVDVRLGERLLLSAGARLDAYSSFGRSLNPRLAVIGKPYQGGNTKLMLGRAFRAPSVYEQYYNDGGVTQVASPNIGPENIVSLELEHAHRFTPTVVGTVAVFANYVSDLVLSAGQGEQSDPLHYVNSQAPIGTFGAELGLRRDWRQGYMLGASYSFQRSRFLNGDSLGALLRFEQSPDFRRVANAPEQLASVKGALPLLGRSLTLGSRLSVEGGRFDRNERIDDAPQGRSEAFALWDVVLSGREERLGFSWAAGVYNAFDWHYSLPVSAEFSQTSIEQDGRTFLLSTELVF